MKRKGKVRVELNRRELRRMGKVHERGTEGFCRAVLATARVPDAPPYGQGLIETGDYVVRRGRDRVAGSGDDEGRLSGGRGVNAAVGWGFPAHFLEFGTIKMRPHPFITPAALEVEPRKDAYLRDANRRTR